MLGSGLPSPKERGRESPTPTDFQTARRVLERGSASYRRFTRIPRRQLRCRTPRRYLFPSFDGILVFNGNHIQGCSRKAF